MTTEERLQSLEVQVQQALELARHHAREHIAVGDDPLEEENAKGHTHLHADTTSQTANQHHDGAHTAASHSDQGATGSELETLTDSSETTLHSHAGGGNHAFDSSAHTDVGAMTEAQGDLIRWSGSAWENFAAVTAGAVVGGNGTDVVATVPERTILLLAQGGTPTTTSGCATAVVVEAATNDVDYWVLDFATGADEFAFWGPIVLPDNYDGGDFKATFYWTAASGSGTVAWAIQMQALANDDAIDTAWPTADVASADTLIAAGDVHITTELTGITPANTPADGDLMFIRVFRDVSADNLGVDARLIAVKLHYTLNAISDN